MHITLNHFEKIDGIRSAMLRAENGIPLSYVTIPAHAARDAINLSRLENRLFDAVIDMIGYADACEISDLGAYADELITGCLIGKIEVIDEEAA